MSYDNIAPIAEAIADLDVQIKTMTKKKKELEAELRPVIVDRGAVKFGDFEFTCRTMTGRKTLDKARMTADGIDLESYMKVGAPYTMMSIKQIAS